MKMIRTADKYPVLEWKYLLQYCAVVLLILIGINNHLMMLMALAFAITVLCFSKTTTTKLQFMLFLLSFSQVFVRHSVGGYTYYLILMMVMVILLQSRKKNVYDIKTIIITFFLLLDIFLCSFTGFSLSLRGQYIVVGILLLTSLSNEKSDIKLDNILIWYSLGIITAAVIALFADNIPNLSMYTRPDHMMVYGVNRFTGLYRNPNYYTYDISVSISAMLMLLAMRKRFSFLYVLITLALLGVGAMSISLSFIISILIAFALFLLHTINSRRGLYVAGAFSSSALIALILIWQSGPMNALWTRITALDIANSNMSSLTTNRTDIWQSFSQALLNDVEVLLAGAGLHATSSSAHNLYLEIVYYFGLLGAILFIVWFVSVFRKAVKKRHIKKSNLKYWSILLLPILVRAFGISLITYMNFWMSMCVLYFALRACYETES